jgi:hypothetical protein
VVLSVGTSAGRRHHGVVHVIGADFIAVRLASGAEVLLAISGLGVVRTAPAVEPALGDRLVATELRLADVLAELAADRERVLLVTTTGEDAVAGQLRGVGHDVVVVRTDGQPPATTYLPLAVIGEVTIG